MNRTCKAAAVWWAVPALLLTITNSALAATVSQLRCEFRRDLVGLDVEKPRLSWVLNSARRGERQTAYQVLAANRCRLFRGAEIQRCISERVTRVLR